MSSAVNASVPVVSGKEGDRRVRLGLILTILLALANIPFLFAPTPDGQEGPPYAILVLSALFGVASIILAIIGWRTHSRAIIRFTAALVIINAITSLPALFVDVDAVIKVVSAVYILASIAAVVLLLGRPRHQP